MEDTCRRAIEATRRVNEKMERKNVANFVLLLKSGVELEKVSMKK